jgi:hypothetical protein
MIFQVIEAGWVFEVDAPDDCRIERTAAGKTVLAVNVGETLEYFEPHAVVRAAKDNLLGLSCSRSWRIDGASRPIDPAQAIRELAVGV